MPAKSPVYEGRGRWLVSRGRLAPRELQEAIGAMPNRVLIQLRVQLAFLRRSAERRSARTWLPMAVRDLEKAEAEELGKRLRAVSEELARRRD